MKINSALNVVLPLTWVEAVDDKGAETMQPGVYGYHTPISRDVFEASFRIIAATKAAIFTKGIAYAAEVGPQIAALTLRDVARQDAIARDEDPETAGLALLLEIKRLTHVLAPGDAGYEMLPIDLALTRGIIAADEWQDAESALVFFTCGWWMAPRPARAKMATGLAAVMRASTTSLPPMDFAGSLPPLMPMVRVDSVLAAPSLVPS